jgi:hypothetical protein
VICRLITTAWGKRYVRQLTETALPALLALGNLPALLREFECEVSISTDSASIDAILDSASVAALRRLCPVLLRNIDDLIGNPAGYGRSLTCSLFRGFDDLGPAMLSAALVFFNADFVLADGSLRSLIPLIRSGERAIMAPSYCVVADAVLPLLEHDGTLTMAPRDMAAMIMLHRHNTIRGKTINQGFCRMRLQDQFYRVIDERTMIGRQFPIALACLRPTRVISEMVTLWDYGILSQACPGVVPYVLADSDDYLMMELRDAETAREYLHSGTMSRREVALGMASFVTDDTLPLGCHTLFLHSSDLPDTALAEVELDRHVSSVIACLPERDYGCFNHPQWLYHQPKE